MIEVVEDMIADRRVLLDAPEVRITLFDGAGSDIVIAIGSVDPTLPGNDLQATSLFKRVGADGATVVVIEDLEWSYLSAPGVRDEIVRCVRSVIELRPGRKIYGFGNSGGATNLMDLCADLGIDGALLVVPQIDVGPAARACDPRFGNWLSWVPEGRPLPNPRSAFRSKARLVILHGLRGADAAHAAMVPSGPKVHRFLFPDLAHDLAARLRPTRRLSRMMLALRNGDIDALSALALEAGAILPDERADFASDPTWTPHPDARPAKKTSTPALANEQSGPDRRTQQ